MPADDPARLARVEGAFHELSELEGDERERRLDELAAGDAALRAEVTALLAAARERPEFLETPPAQPDDEEPPPTTIGPYRLLREIGRGGMGRVYLAEQTGEAFRRLVAVKLLAWAGPFRERFRAEQRILAALEHPGIARLYDGGTTEDGRPFLVLEYVDGENLLDHSARRGLGLEARLGLFREVCAAVDHAHRHLVVHRDLKPANILVTPDGAPKLLDFGIAKLLQPDRDGDETEAGLRAMTPRYASPEQLRGEPVTTASDVYSLGVVLFELLTGSSPYRRTTGSPEELLRAVAEQAPRRPSTAAVEPEPVPRRSLRGDLDTIVLKALDPEPARRYRSAAELADDLGRYLAGRPVRARPAAVGYRLRKFVGRHRWGVAAGSLAIASLLAGAGLAAWQARAARRAEAAARAEAATAERVSAFLVDLFKINEPGEAMGSRVTARELLDRGALRIEEQLADEPAARARLLRAIGRAYAELGLYAPAAAAFDRELEAERGLYGEQSAEVASTLAVVASTLMKQGEYRPALEAARRAQAIQERAPRPDELALADTLSQLGIAHWYLDELGEARRHLERSLALREGRLGPDHPELGGILNNVAILRAQEGDYPGAIALYERALALFERAHGPDHPSVVRTLNNLAIAVLESGDPARARPLHERALAARRRLLEPGHPEIAESLNNLGETLRAAGELAAARAALEEALVLRERALGADHPHVATTLTNLGLVLTGLDEPAAARAALERAIRAFTAALGPEAWQIGYALRGVAALDRRAGDLPAASASLDRASELLAASLPADHPELVAVRAEAAAVRDELAAARR